MKTLTLIGLVTLLPAASVLAQSPAFEAQSLPEAFAVFDEFCVKPLPSVDEFVAALNRSDLDWERVQRRERVRRLDPPNYFQSRAGELSYVIADGLPTSMGSPTCHSTFRTDAAYSHDEAAALVAARLNLGEGASERTRRSPQTKWEAITGDGMAIRVFLTSNVELDGERAARLSISRLRDRD